MRRFRYRLDPVIRLRARALEFERLELARAERRLSQLEREEDRSRSRASAAAAAFMNRAREGVRAGEYFLLRQGVAHGFEVVRKAAQAVEAAREPLERARRAVVRAHTRLRSLEVLREKAFDAHRRVVLSAEQREMDEIAGRREAREAVEARGRRWRRGETEGAAGGREGSR